MTDLTVVVTAHDETAVCGPTMRAADLAVQAARARGWAVQTIVALDAPTEATAAYFHQPHFDHWERRTLHERELGRLRNALVPECEGRFLAFLDADHLVSENWLAEALTLLVAAEERGERVIAHPELEAVFDGQTTVRLTIDQDSSLFTPHHLYVRDYYVCPGMAPRAAHLEHRYATTDVPGGSIAGDLRWTLETLNGGWRHKVVRDTVIFERCRDLLPVTQSIQRESLTRALPAMAIDRVRGLGRPAGRAGTGAPEGPD